MLSFHVFFLSLLELLRLFLCFCHTAAFFYSFFFFASLSFCLIFLSFLYPVSLLSSVTFILSLPIIRIAVLTVVVALTFPFCNTEGLGSSPRCPKTRFKIPNPPDAMPSKWRGSWVSAQGVDRSLGSAPQTALHWPAIAWATKVEPNEGLSWSVSPISVQ